MSHSQLLVVTADHPVAYIGRDPRRGSFCFRYADIWRNSPSAFSLSPYFSFLDENISSRTVLDYLANLLPEGQSRWVGDVRNKLSSANFISLANVCGEEPSGAFSILKASHSDHSTEAISPFAMHLRDVEIADQIANRDRVPFSLWHGRFYQSLAGTQDKMQVGLQSRKLYLLDGGLSSTHIIKPEARDPATPFMVANEHYCMSLASAMGLPVAPVHIRRTPNPILVIERFDRMWSAKSDILKPGEVARVHAIDGCQAVGAASWEKYEQCTNNPSVGVSFKRLFKLRPFFTNPDEARLFIIRWALFGLLIGNSDVHAKNISFFQAADGLTPAPMYDLTSTRVYGDAILQNIAVGYGGAFKFEDISEAQMVRFAEDADTPIDEVAFEMSRLATTAQKHFQQLVEAGTYTQSEQALVSGIANIVRARIDWMHEMADKLFVQKATLRDAS